MAPGRIEEEPPEHTFPLRPHLTNGDGASDGADGGPVSWLPEDIRPRSGQPPPITVIARDDVFQMPAEGLKLLLRPLSLHLFPRDRNGNPVRYPITNEKYYGVTASGAHLLHTPGSNNASAQNTIRGSAGRCIEWRPVHGLSLDSLVRDLALYGYKIRWELAVFQRQYRSRMAHYNRDIVVQLGLLAINFETLLRADHDLEVILHVTLGQNGLTVEVVEPDALEA